jgi:hypothetical protein
MQRLKARLTIEEYGRGALGNGNCKKCKKPIIAHVGEDCLFDFTQLDAAPLERILAALFQGKVPKDGKLTLEIVGGASVTYLVKASSYKYSITNDPVYYELGRIGAAYGPPTGAAVELELVGVGE